MAGRKKTAHGNIVRKYRIYPNKEQEIYFVKCFGCVRFVYNSVGDVPLFYKWGQKLTKLSGGHQTPTQLQPPADCRNAHKSFVMLRMTRIPQQERWSVLD